MIQIVRKNEFVLLKETARIYQRILRYSPDGFVLVDMQGKFLDVNEAYCALLGYTRKKMLQMSVEDVEVYENPEEILGHLRRIKRRRRDRFLTRHRDKHGVLIDVEVSAHYSEDMGGIVVVFLRDIRDRRRTEQLLEKAREESKQKTEQLLLESYKYMGVVNRKISLLSELEKSAKLEMKKDEVVEYVLHIAMKVSDATMGYLYSRVGRGKYRLLSCKGLEKDQCERVSNLSSRRIEVLRSLYKKKHRLNGDIRKYKIDLLALNKKLKYFVTLPIVKEKNLVGFIFLGLDQKAGLETQDFEFLDIFALHASSALCRSGIF